MAKNKKVEMTLEEKLEKALVPVEEQAYKIPNNWVWTRLGEVNEIITGNTPSKNEDIFWENKDIFFVKPDDLSQGRHLIHSKEYIDKRAIKKIRMLPKNTTLICCIGSIGKVAYSEVESCSNQQINSLVAKKNCIYPLYNYYLVNSIFFQSQMLENSSATTISILNKSTTEKLLFPLPPLNEQRRIVEKLDFLFEKTKKAKEIIGEIKADIENRKISILDRAFKGILTSKWRNENKTSDVKELLKFINDEKIRKWEEDCLQAEKEGSKKPKKPIIKEIEDMIVPVDEQPYELPNNWVWVRLGDLSELISGYAFDSHDFKEKSDFQVLRLGNIKDNLLILDKQAVFIESSIAEKANKSLCFEDDILVTMTGTRNKRDYFFSVKIPKNQKFHFNQRVGCIRCNISKTSNYIYYILKVKFILDQIFATETGSVNQGNISIKAIASLTIPFPPLEEQQEIVRILDEVLENENKVKELLELEERIDILEKSILNKAFKGELGTQNNSDKPAMELLREILNI